MNLIPRESTAALDPRRRPASAPGRQHLAAAEPRCPRAVHRPSPSRPRMTSLSELAASGDSGQVLTIRGSPGRARPGPAFTGID